MGRGAVIRGKVVGPDGAPRAAELVRVWPEACEHPPFELPMAITDDSGNYEIRHVPEGAMVVGAATLSPPVTTRHGEETTIDFTL
jgi:hypothetical protein